MTLASEMIYRLIRKTRFNDRSFCTIGPNLPLFIKQSVSIDVFKKNLKTHYPCFVTNCDEYTPYPCVVTGNKDIWIYYNFEIRDITLKLFSRALQSLCHAHLHNIGIMCSMLYYDDLNSMGGVWETIYHQQTDQRFDDSRITPLITSVGSIIMWWKRTVNK